MQPRQEVLAGVPEFYSQCMDEPAFDIIATTFCFWSDPSDSSRKHGPIRLPSGHDPDGSVGLLSLLDGNPETYQNFADGYFEVAVELQNIEHIYAHRPLTAELVHKLNPERTLESLVEELAEIGYPSI